MFSSFKLSSLRARSKSVSQVVAEDGLTAKPPKTPVGSPKQRKLHKRRTSDVGSCPTIASLRPGTVAHQSDQLVPGDRIHSINGINTSRMRPDELSALLDNVDEAAHLEVEYTLPNYTSQNSLCMGTRVTNITLERVDGSLGITLRGGAHSTDPLQSKPLIVTHVRPHGPAHRTGRIKVGDRVLKVDNYSLTNKTLLEAQLLLKQTDSSTTLNQLGSTLTTLTVEYDVSVIESVKYATGPLLVEIERHVSEDLGIILNSCNDFEQDDIVPVGVYIESIVPASIADRCGALHVGDQLLAVDDAYIETNSATPEEVMQLLQNYTSSEGITRLQILPYHTISRPAQANWVEAGSPSSPSISGFSTFNSRRSRQRNRFVRQSSLPKSYDNDGGSFQGSSNFCGYSPQLGVCHIDTLTITLNAQEHVGYGLKVNTDNSSGEQQANIVITHIANDSPAYRCGCLQVGDRIVAINHQYNLTLQEINSLLELGCDSTNGNGSRVTLQTEFDVTDTIVPASGVFTVKLAKRGPGLGITITASKVIQDDPFIISDIRRGSIAHRTGTLQVGDRLLAIDNRTLDHLSLESAFEILQSSPSDIVTLRIQKCEQEQEEDTHVVYTVELARRGGPLGITISGSEDCTEPVILSRLTEGGLAEKTGALHVGDRILAINGESLEHRPLSDAIRLLQSSGDNVQLKIARQIKDNLNMNCHPIFEEARGNYSSPGLASIDSAVESWDSGVGEISNMDNPAVKETLNTISPDNTEALDQESIPPVSPTIKKHESQIQFYSDMEDSVCPSPLPLPNYSFTNTLNSKYGSSYFICQKPHLNYNYRYRNDMDDRTFTGESNSTSDMDEIHHVTLYKDSVYDDYGFSVSDGLYEKGVYINRIRRGGPAHMAGVLRPYDRILQVNDTKTADFDCCLTVPLIASAGDKIELIISRNPYINYTDDKDIHALSWTPDEQELSRMPAKQFSSSQNTITKTL